MKGKPYPAEFVDLILEQVKTSSKSVVEIARENGYQEFFYGKFKLELGNLSQHNTLEEAILAIYKQIYYYKSPSTTLPLKIFLLILGGSILNDKT